MKYGWSTTLSEWERLRTALGNCDRRFPLEESWAGQIASTAGVYCIIGMPPHNLTGDLRTVLYAGQSKDLRARFRAHLRGQRGIREIKRVFVRLEFIYWEVVPARLGSSEQMLITCFGPVGNRQAAIRGVISEPVPAGSL